jgi:beta-glucuronidase
MLGLYDRTPGRRKVVLDGWWEFCTDPLSSGEADAYYDRFPNGCHVWVPGCWNTEFGLRDYQGLAWYKKAFEPGFEGRARLLFGAVADRAKVWLNGHFLGEHEGGFTAFEFIADLGPGANELVVCADNRHSDLTLPKDGVDWFPYGGITRSAICEQIAPAYVRAVHVRGSTGGQVQVRAFLENLGQEEETLPLRLSIDGQPYCDRQLSISAGARRGVALRAQIEEPLPWSPESPHLYRAEVRLGHARAVRPGPLAGRNASHHVRLGPVLARPAARPGRPDLPERVHWLVRGATGGG